MKMGVFRLRWTAIYFLFYCISSFTIPEKCTTQVARPDYHFPKDFIIGAATAAFQIEGAWNESGKGESIWDREMHEHVDWIADKSNGDVACDSYHKYQEDIQMLKVLGVNFYRFSISWPRILPKGKIDNINQAGIDYYNNVINGLLAHNITPYVTLYHWDLPQALQDEGGWLNRTLADYFVEYAKLLFQEFGDRVKHWITLNEPMQFCEGGYSAPENSNVCFAPFINKPGVGGYEAAHTALIAHARTYRLYEKEFRKHQKGVVGISIDGAWYEPRDPYNKKDREAAETALQMNYGWFVNPIINGDYPKIMIERIRKNSKEEGFTKSRLPKFTSQEQKMLKGSFDFLGLNHYETMLCYFDEKNAGPRPSHPYDVGVVTYYDPSWPETASPWMKVVPWGLTKLLIWIKNHYNNPRVIITENGMSDNGELDDYTRGNYYKEYLYAVLKAIYEENCNVKGYTAWSLMDNLEWMLGYTVKFGLHNVDFKDPKRPRTRKLSSYVFEHIIANKRIDWDYTPKWPPT